MRKAMDREALLAEGYQQDQIQQIMEGRKEGLNVSLYEDKDYLAIQMRQIRLGLLEGLNVSLYRDKAFDWFQMEEIRLGLSEGLNVAVYASPAISYERMRQIRLGLKEGIDLSRYKKLEAGVLKELRKALASRVNITGYIQEGFETEQLEQMRLALEQGVDVRPYVTPAYRGVSIREIRLGLEKGLDVGQFAKLNYNWQQMRELRLGMEHRVDISQYNHPYYSWQQMHEIRLGLMEHLPVERYKSFMYTALEMKKKRLALSEQRLQKQVYEAPALAPMDHFLITVSPDEMEAYIERTTDVKGLTEEDVRKALIYYRVQAGVLESEIPRLLAGKARRRVLIAKGKEAEAGKDGWYEFFFRRLPERKPKMLADGSVDYQNTEWFEMVRAGQKLACYHEAECGENGYTVTGRVLYSVRGMEKSVLRGRGFQLQPDNKTYLAMMDGRIEMEHDTIEISRMMMLNEVTPNTGNVDFDGCIYVKGNVSRGVQMKASGDIMIDGFMESAFIQCGGNLIIRKGVNDAGNGFLQVGKSLTSNFLEAVKAHVKGDIQVNYCLNCDLYTEGRMIVSGTSGSLAGGSVHAVRGLSAYNVGNRVGLPTYVRLGINEDMLRKQSYLEEAIRGVNEELNILGNSYLDFQRKYPPEVRNAMPIYLKIESAVYTKEKQLESLYLEKTQLDAMIKDTADVKGHIRGKLNEGVTVEINGISWQAKSVANVTLRKNAGRIAVYSN